MYIKKQYVNFFLPLKSPYEQKLNFSCGANRQSDVHLCLDTRWNANIVALYRIVIDRSYSDQLQFIARSAEEKTTFDW
ncbi:hypothetical protein DERF_013452 [Dermatophagoides farinae]|uniref:Uncharacterized protein n=1 Tax=Dermatophagoides farinae TaxID=6954 RepID=A0A922KWF2_DERFA|nr:hypothetical protein DERF_013452 [Dermatophagoides farinae]